MKEEEFIKEIGMLNLTYLDLNLSVEIPVYYTLNEEENVILDIESMKEEFESKLKEIEKVLNK